LLELNAVRNGHKILHAISKLQRSANFKDFLTSILEEIYCSYRLEIIEGLKYFCGGLWYYTA